MVGNIIAGTALAIVMELVIMLMGGKPTVFENFLLTMICITYMTLVDMGHEMGKR